MQFVLCAGGVKFVKDLWSQVWTKIHAWLEIRRDALAPRCVRGIGMLLMRGDRKVHIYFLNKSFMFI